MGDGGGEGKRGEGGRVGGNCDGERNCPKGMFSGEIEPRKQEIQESMQYTM